MRILTLSNCDLVESQGSGYVITGFVQGLRDLGCEVRAVGPCDLIFCPTISVGRQHRLAIGIWLKCLRHIKEFRPDVVEFYGGPAWLATLLLSLRWKRPFLIAAHSNGLEPFVKETLNKLGIYNSFDGGFRNWIQRISSCLNQCQYAFTKADVIVTVSEREREFALERHYQSENRILAINNALPDEFLRQPVNGIDKKTIGFCGSWTIRKGINLLVPALISVMREFPDWSVHLVGVGEQFRIQDHFPSKFISRIKTESFVENKTVLKDIYRSWAIVVMPSLYESFGLVAAEAMACGCALVATKTGFAACLKDNAEACLVEPTTASLLNGLRNLITHPELRERVAIAGQLRVQALRWSDNVHRLHDFYLCHLQRRLKKTDATSH